MSLEMFLVPSFPYYAKLCGVCVLIVSFVGKKCAGVFEAMKNS